MNNHQYQGRGRAQPYNNGSWSYEAPGSMPQRGGFYGSGGRSRGQRGARKGREFVRTDKQRDNGSVSVGVPRGDKPSEGPPKPQHLSKVASEERNDPLWREAVFSDASDELKPRARELNYFPGCEGFTELVTQSHEVLKTQTPGFSKRVPLNVYQYYNAVLLYSRLLEIHSDNGYSIAYEELEFVRVVKQAEYPVASPIAAYLAGLGNTTMPSGRDVDLKLLPRTYEESNDGSIGWFGQVAADTHYLYRMYPCLAVYVKNISASIAYTANPDQAHRDWNLPDDIRPVEEDAGLPTANMMGYTLPSKYGPEQSTFLAELGFGPDVVPDSVNTDIPLLLDVMIAVQAEMGFTKAFKLDSVPKTLTGTQGLNLMTSPVDSDRRIRRPAVNENVIAKSLTKLSSSVGFLGGAFRYRQNYHVDAVHNIFTGSVYRFDNFVVPAEWVATANRPRDAEEAGSPAYNMFEFYTQEFVPSSRISLLIKHDRQLPV